MIKIAICDDERQQLNILKNIISINLDLKGLEYRIYEFDCGENLVESLSENTYDIIFSDIEMKILDGIETAKKIRLQDKKSIIIFVTSHPDFVFQGYDVKAFNYILKPYNSEKIVDVLYSALEELEDVQDNFFLIELKSGTHKLNLNNTLYFTSDKRKIDAVTLDGNIDFYYKLNDLEEVLPSFFIRIHQRYLVNLNFISSIEGSSLIINNESLPISRTYQQDLMIAFAKILLK